MFWMYVRSWLLYIITPILGLIWFLTYFLIVILSLGTVFLIPAKTRQNIAFTSFFKLILKIIKVLVKIDYKVEGIENIPKEPSIICSKHQSAYETVALFAIFPPAVFIMKKGLLLVPVVNLFVLGLNSIMINRSKAKEAFKIIKEKGLKRKKAGFWIAIFPEGTRVPVGSKDKYKEGAAVIAKQLEMNLVPVSLNSGLFWPRRVILKKPGTVTFVIHKPIPYDSFNSSKELMKECTRVIESAQERIEKL